MTTPSGSRVGGKLSNAAFIFGTDAVSLTPRDGPAWKSKVKKFLWPRLFRLADQVIVPSASGVDLMRSLGIPQERVTLTPFVVDTDWWMQQSKLVDRPAVRAGWGAAPDTLVILFCAKLQPWKRPLDLLRAFAKANLSNAILVFAGAGPLLPQLESEAASLGVASRVRFLGFLNQTQLPAVYTAADLLMLPSEFEPFGLVVNEAMCCGCAVAASDRCGAARELVAPVDSRLVFPCGESTGRIGLAHIQTWSPERNIDATTGAIHKAISRIGRAAIERPSDSVAPAGRQGIHQ